jgi:Na+-transporting NADH:ubiquinone oxidoreductase subunit NqrA
VVPEQESFTIQVLTPDFVLEMDVADADKVLKALGLFETKKVLEVDFDEPSSVRSQITRYRKRCFWSRTISLFWIVHGQTRMSTS